MRENSLAKSYLYFSYYHMCWYFIIFVGILFFSVVSLISFILFFVLLFLLFFVLLSSPWSRIFLSSHYLYWKLFYLTCKLSSLLMLIFKLCLKCRWNLILHWNYPQITPPGLITQAHDRLCVINTKTSLQGSHVLSSIKTFNSKDFIFLSIFLTFLIILELSDTKSSYVFLYGLLGYFYQILNTLFIYIFIFYLENIVFLYGAISITVFTLSKMTKLNIFVFLKTLSTLLVPSSIWSYWGKLYARLIFRLLV